jgi:chorismate mutase
VLTQNIQKLSDWGLDVNGPIIIAGPCSAESEEQVMKTAIAISRQNITILRVGIWKPRTRPNTFEGVGSIGLDWAIKASKEINKPVAVEVANPYHVDECLKKGVDILWIGARTTANPFSVQAIADALKGIDIPVMVKNPVNPELDLWIGALERVHNAGITKLAAIHRGFSTLDKTKYRNKPKWEIPIELKRLVPDLPVICDPSHICGNRELLLTVAQQAIDLDFDGLMIETHIDPEIALSDSKQQVTPEGLDALLSKIIYKKTFSSDESFYRELEKLRADIDVFDNQLLDILSRRMEVSRQIGVIKEKSKVTIYQPSRWDEVVSNRVKIGMSYGFSEEFIRNIYQNIHQESILQQTHISL